jgi:uncharacterized protein YjbJ (UPF0337 family)
VAGNDNSRNLGDEIAGRAKKAWGKLTNDEELEAEGRAQHTGDAKRGYDDYPTINQGLSGAGLPPAGVGEAPERDIERALRGQSLPGAPGGSVGGNPVTNEDLWGKEQDPAGPSARGDDALGYPGEAGPGGQPTQP